LHGDVSEDAFGRSEFISGVHREDHRPTRNIAVAANCVIGWQKNSRVYRCARLWCPGAIITPGTQARCFAIGAVAAGDRVAIVRPDYFAGSSSSSRR
jgi:hypothetical protein